jgi:hypothetical protein
MWTAVENLFQLDDLEVSIAYHSRTLETCPKSKYSARLLKGKSRIESNTPTNEDL